MDSKPLVQWILTCFENASNENLLKAMDLFSLSLPPCLLPISSPTLYQLLPSSPWGRVQGTAPVPVLTLGPAPQPDPAFVFTCNS